MLTHFGAGRGEPARGKSSKHPVRKVSEVLPKVFQNLGITEEVERQEVLVRWAEVVGERIAAVTDATAVSRGVLFVRVVSSGWLTELNLMRHNILRRLNAGRGRGRIEKIVFTLSEGGSSHSGQSHGVREGDR